jgi:hypothetical protein
MRAPLGMGTMHRMCSAPLLAAYMPVMMVLRAGAHTGTPDQARVNSMPRAASASTLGVRAFGSP